MVMEMDNAILKIINNLSFSKSKTKWEVIGKLSEVYLKTGDQLRVDMLEGHLKKMGVNVNVTAPYEKYRAEVLELIKILVNSPQ